MIKKIIKRNHKHQEDTESLNYFKENNDEKLEILALRKELFNRHNL